MNFKNEIKEFHKSVVNNLPSFLRTIFWLISNINQLKARDSNGGESERYLEFIGMAETLDISVHDVALINFAYELLASGTTIIAHGKKGEILHAKNMDFPKFFSLTNATYNAHFYKNGKVLFKTTMLAGHTGIFTAFKPRKFAISLNQRGSRTFLGTFTNIFRWLICSSSPSSLLKHVAENAESYEDAKNMLETYPISAPVYFGISGVSSNKAELITRDLTSSADVWLINNQSPKDWALVQTNYEHWISPSPDSDKNRVNTAYRQLKSVGKENLNSERLLKDVLQVSQIYNEETVYSTVMNANDR